MYMHFYARFVYVYLSIDESRHEASDLLLAATNWVQLNGHKLHPDSGVTEQS